MRYTDPDPLVVELRQEYGPDWHIQRDAETGIWTAVAYPSPTATRVLVGRDAGQLRAKLDAATGGGLRPRLRGDDGT